ncbi:class 3 adenylate cyclase [Mycobacterium frederiksbergense]|uniref:Class 3 adenylate cyclase n=1 Tax=Mycolicibacterium frederiksbergense TaxID=117567 RepID=A0ABT6KZQ3_9MYCO|nr:LuxR family transcriptional regulator [Mycolicibacterium frederiksbergense]MDH6195796.1 class 3 adenylate cyclase [Mycolicibacterium frederiksbergense]
MTEKPPTAAMTWLMARTEGSARLWKTEPGEMAAALPWMRATVTHLVALHGGILSAGRAGCDSFAATFGRASDAVACALYLQLAGLDPFALCIGVHSGDTGAVLLRDIAHGGQTLIAGTTATSAADRLPSKTTLKCLGSHRTADPQRQEPLLQLCHPGLPRPLYVPNAVLAEHLVN